MPSTILSDNGVTSGTAGIKTTGSNDGQLALQTTTAGGAATTALEINTSQQVSFTAGTAAAPAITPTGDTNTGIFFPAADTIAFAEGGAEAMRINSSGNVGIGTTSPGTKLEVSHSSLSYTDGLILTNSLNFGYGNSITFRAVLTDGGSVGNAARIQQSYESSNNYNLIFSTTGSGTLTERARITSGGGFLLGTATAGAGWGSGGTILTVDEGATFGVIKNSGGSSSPVLLIWNATGTTDNGFLTFATETGGSTRGSIDYNRTGGLTRYNTTSDATLKNIIGDADGQKSLEILNSTRIREFAWKDDPTQKPQIGVIAQELYETYKGAVSVGGDFERERDVNEEVEEEYTDEEGNTQTRTVTKVVGKETYTEYRPWGVDKTAFTFHLIAGWQAHEKLLKEAMTRIEALEAEVAAMKAK